MNSYYNYPKSFYKRLFIMTLFLTFFFGQVFFKILSITIFVILQRLQQKNYHINDNFLLQIELFVKISFQLVLINRVHIIKKNGFFLLELCNLKFPLFHTLVSTLSKYSIFFFLW